MKFQIKLILGLSLLCASSIAWFALTPSVAPMTTATEPAVRRPAKSGVVEFERDPSAPAALQEVPANANGEEPGSINQWHARFTALVDECGKHEEAGARLISELDQQYHAWVSAKVAALADLPPLDRYDELAEMDARVRKIAEVVLGHLGIAGGRHHDVLAATLEALSAEVRYAELSGTHEQRVAMLRLDRERESRFGDLLAANGLGPGTETQVRNEIEPWYESELRRIVGADDTDETN